jgi:hypothetical protein
MKWFLLSILVLIPVIGYYFVYVAYRIHFKADYSNLKKSEGTAPDNPETYAGPIAKAHLVGGVLIQLSLLLLPKVSPVDIAKVVTSSERWSRCMRIRC